MAGLFPDSPRTHVKAGFKSRDWISIFCKDLWVFFFFIQNFSGHIFLSLFEINDLLVYTRVQVEF